jgi:hypothetical protein
VPPPAADAAKRAPTDTPLLVVGLLVVLGVVLGYLGSHWLRRPYHDLVADDASLARARATPGLHVLFVGNSFTFYNDMPGLVEGLAAAEGRPVVARLFTVGGARLSEHAANPRVAAAMDKVPWDYVVLQEHSELPSRPDADRRVYPAVRRLAGLARTAGSRVLLYQTWGYRAGDGDIPGKDDYAAMQRRLEHGYGVIAEELGVPVVPVGQAWAEALRQQPTIGLWDTDGKHPSLLGSYLAACVFYRVLYAKSPEGNRFLGGLPQGDATFLQGVAASILL